MKKYEIKYQENGEIKSQTIQTENIKIEKLPSNLLSILEKKSKKEFFKKRAKHSDIVALFGELEIMLNANILLNDAVEILYKSTTKQELKQILSKFLYALQNGKDLDIELQEFKSSLGETPLIFLKIAQQNGNLKEIIGSLSTILKDAKQKKEQLLNSLRYPFILLFSLIGLVLFSFYFVVPKFEHLFLQYGSNLPLATKYLLFFKDFIHNYFVYIVLVFISLVAFIVFQYKNSKKFRYLFDRFLVLKVPIVSKLILYSNFQKLFLTIAILLNSKYRFQTAFNSTKILIKNLYLQESLEKINQQIQSGKSLLFAFENSKFFDEFTLRLISVGEQSNSLHTTIKEIEKIYKKREEELFKMFTNYIEPLFLLLTSAFIVWLMLAIFMPIWNLNEALSM